jgi:hypothetical protein
MRSWASRAACASRYPLKGVSNQPSLNARPGIFATPLIGTACGHTERAWSRLSHYFDLQQQHRLWHREQSPERSW